MKADRLERLEHKMPTGSELSMVLPEPLDQALVAGRYDLEAGQGVPRRSGGARGKRLVADQQRRLFADVGVEGVAAAVRRRSVSGTEAAGEQQQQRQFAALLRAASELHLRRGDRSWPVDNEQRTTNITAV